MRRSFQAAAWLFLVGTALGEPEPTVADVSYGPHERNVMDAWLAKSDEPTPMLVYIHGGGFKKGDKRSARRERLLPICLKEGVSFASINYRYHGMAQFSEILLDGARAVQFIRTRAEAWNIDPKRIGVYGSSAGAIMSLWIAFHDDVADEKSDDPVLRQSSRVAVAGGLATPVGTEIFCLVHVDETDPPIFQFNRVDPGDKDNIHHPMHAIAVRDRCEKFGVENLLLLEHGDPPFQGDRTFEQKAFFFKHLRVGQSKD